MQENVRSRQKEVPGPPEEIEMKNRHRQEMRRGKKIRRLRRDIMAPKRKLWKTRDGKEESQ